MPFYESVFIARQDISAAQAEALAETFAGIVKANGGQVAKVEHWGLKTLAYKIKKNRKGHYVMFQLDSPHAAVAEMERNMGLNEDVLRIMTTRIEVLEPGQSAMMQARGERSERGERGERGRRGDGERGDRGDRPRGPRRVESVEGEAS